MSKFQVIPAIELRGGMALRYESTGMGTRANRVEPVGFAKKFAAAGATMLHLYNLDGPFIVSTIEHSGSVLAGAERNLTVMGEIAKSLQITVQVSGGVRDLDSFKQVTKLGITRAGIGSSAMHDPKLVADAVKHAADSVVIFLDVKGGKLVSQEWVPGNATVVQVAQKIRDAGVKRFIYQDVAADSSGRGPSLADAAAIGKLGVEVYVTGGIHTLDQVKQAAGTEGIAGVIIGKPFAMGEFTYPQALEYAKAGLAGRG